MKWRKIPDSNIRNILPKSGQFLVVWKDVICLCEYDDDEDSFWISYLPAQYETFELQRERELKITHWCELEYPKDTE